MNEDLWHGKKIIGDSEAKLTFVFQFMSRGTKVLLVNSGLESHTAWSLGHKRAHINLAYISYFSPVSWMFFTSEVLCPSKAPSARCHIIEASRSLTQWILYTRLCRKYVCDFSVTQVMVVWDASVKVNWTSSWPHGTSITLTIALTFTSQAKSHFEHSQLTGKADTSVLKMQGGIMTFHLRQVLHFAFQTRTTAML